VGLAGQGQNGFDVLLKYTSAVFWLFFLLTGLSLFVLRWKDRGIDRPFRVPLYPWVPLLFCGCSGFLLCGSVVYAWKQSLLGLLILLVGLPLYLLSRRAKRLEHAPLSGPLSLRSKSEIRIAKSEYQGSDSR
jgi:amino acid transporter